ncbi:DUF4279 domain-containing protein [Amycolatopsis sp. DG1A-15b]|uniref:DUF4279 domain-containing protein n=1 Tax=Amycolatopsis sp. DG1A-15b TaxID=3052846 RepID=UPI00255BAE3B|nr:DUF4279 domain-containing protein [Amycolatopsis sp. DG1A-15b]WIX92788.1 DUF4279 domain-containing protein [Amycolatopsis sp. DG1A-15b]
MLRDDAAVQAGATFRLSGDQGGSAAAVTRLLGLEPTHSFEAGDRVGRRSAAIRRGSLWMLSSDLPSDRELADHLHLLLDRLEPKAEALWQLTTQGYVADWFCLAASQATEHAIELDRPLLQRLLAVPGDLLLDVMGDDD